ncbi:cytochrome c biogenesis CcdA family protein [Rhodovulum sp. DZ06]|uniref:cytochrome c biogenesis CcdA family protein n=1 Tax=Rhodovulum sp. DZ06 TaxID=3425126 RepID=UPI003D3591BA
MESIGILTAFIGGLLSFLSPCVLPLAPPYLAFLAGTTLDQVSGEEVDAKVARRVQIASLFFVAGLGTVFVTLGATASALGQALAMHKYLLGQIAGGVIVLMGLHFLGIIRIPFLYREARLQGPAQAGSYGGAYVMGLAFAFGWTPCIGPILGSILGLAAQEDSIAQGVAMLSVYALGLGTPFVLAAFFVKPFLAWATRFRRHMGMVEKAMGAMLIAVGILMISGSFSDISYWLLETFPVLGTIG